MSRYIMVSSYDEHIEAEIVVKQLAQAGIKAKIRRHSPIGITRLINAGVGTYSVRVLEKDIAAACELLQIQTANMHPLRKKPVILCPQCDSEKIKSRTGFFSILVDFYLFDFCAFFMKRKNNRHTCEKCGHQWHIYFSRNG